MLKGGAYQVQALTENTSPTVECKNVNSVCGLLVSYHSFLQNLLIVPLELKCFLEIQISGSQRYSEIDPAHI